MSSRGREAGAQGAAADPHRMLGAEPLHHLVQRDVLALLDQPEDEGFMRIEAGGAAAALRAWRQFADLRSRNPADRAGHYHAEPRRRLPRRHALVRSLQDPRPKIPAQCSSHRPPPSRWMLNQHKTHPSHHNRFIDHRTCSSAIAIAEPIGQSSLLPEISKSTIISRTSCALPSLFN